MKHVEWPRRLAVIATHPIQYHAPLFRQITARGAVNLRVFYGWKGAAEQHTHDVGFGQQIQWDVPLLNGYAHEFVPNRSPHPGTHHFGGIDGPELVPRVLAWRPHAVLIFGWAWKSHLRALTALHGRMPVLFRGDSTLLDERTGPRKYMRRAWLRWVFCHVDRALYVGQHNRAYFEAHGLSSEHVSWAPHAVENERFADPTGRHRAEAEQWRRRLGIASDTRTILFAGKFESKKAPDLLLEAFLGLEDPNARLLFAGSGVLEKALRERAREDRRVCFLGFQNQSAMPTVYRLGDAVVLPSLKGETWGLAVNEAMACGRPVVVSSRVGCAPDLVREGETGHIVPAGQVGVLREKLFRMTSNLHECVRMGEAAARLIKCWSIDRQAACIEAAELQLHSEGRFSI